MAISTNTLVEVFPPGEYIQDELEARGWLQTDLVDILGVDKKTVSDIIAGKRSITPDMAVLIGEAFGTGPEVWLNLDNAYRLHHTRCGADRVREVSRKSELYAKYPIRQMANRGWLSQTKDMALLEQELAAFFTPEDLGFAARRSGDEAKEPLQLAWLYRAHHLARTLPAEPFSETALARAFPELKTLLRDPADLVRLPEILARAGVRILIVEALPTSQIDGVCFWLDQKMPVVALSTRLDRIDNFWFTLMHELMHVKYGHGRERAMLDVDILGRKDDIPKEERLANEGAAEFCVPQAELEAFIAHTRPGFSMAKITAFAEDIQAHPGLVVGQLQHRGVIEYRQHRGALKKVRSALLADVAFDGWGEVATTTA
ncbi:MAG: HigA family addiction module antidote protein [Candidatus Hydrogenedentes bacterium]|nr:HigA family addiction module antidote protein [Candidatus Hydrogenedentota bacterium]